MDSAKAFQSWFLKNGGYISSAVDLKEDVIEAGQVQRGLFAARDICEGENLLVVPHDLLIFAEDTDISSVTTAASENSGEDENATADKQGAKMDVWYASLALALLRALKTEKFSHFSTLLGSLESEEACHAEVSTDDASEDLIKSLHVPISSWIMSWRAFLKHLHISLCKDSARTDVSWVQFKRAVRYCLSHAHRFCDSELRVNSNGNRNHESTDKGAASCIAVFGDLFNHNSVGNVRRFISQHDEDKTAVECPSPMEKANMIFQARRRIKTGEELLFAYDSSHPSSNDVFLHQYGFVPEANGAENALLDFRKRLAGVFAQSGKAVETSQMTSRRDECEAVKARDEDKQSRKLRILKMLLLHRSGALNHGTNLGPKGFVSALPNSLLCSSVLAARTVAAVLAAASPENSSKQTHNVAVEGANEHNGIELVEEQRSVTATRLLLDAVEDARQQAQQGLDCVKNFPSTDAREKSIQNVFVRYLEEKKNFLSSLKQSLSKAARNYVAYANLQR